MRFGKIGARSMMYQWKNPYITDGLVAMWDGEWNAGGGVHDDEHIITNLVSGVQTMIPNLGYTINGNSIISAVSYSFLFNDILPITGKTEFTLESVGCCESKPTIASNTSGSFSVRGIGLLFMWRKDINSNSGVTGIVGCGVYRQSDGRIHYYGAPSNVVVANQEVDAEVFGVMHSRSAVFSIAGNSAPLLYRDGHANDGTNTMSYTDAVVTTNLYRVSTPSASSCAVRWANLRVYYRALTADEIAHNYAIDRARFNLP